MIDGPADERRLRFLRWLAELAPTTGVAMIVEGVETDEQQRFLLQHGCDMVQGYLLSRPLNAVDCLRFLQDWQAQAPVRLDPVASPP